MPSMTSTIVVGPLRYAVTPRKICESGAQLVSSHSISQFIVHLDILAPQIGIVTLCGLADASATPTDLLLVHLERVAILHVELQKYQSARFLHRCLYSKTHIVWSIWRIHSLPIEEEAAALRCFALPLTERIHKLLKLCCSLDLEEDLVVVVRHFDVDVAWLLRLFCRSIAAWRLRTVLCHCVDRSSKVWKM